jgi:predicted nucleic acid-binding protein
MTVVFADTAFYVALLSSRDALHSRAVQFLAGYSGQIVTTEFILLEVANFNARPADRKRFVDLVAQIHNDPQTQLIPATSDLFARGVELFAKRPDKYWSLTDCTSFVVMTDRRLTDALTADEHFEQAGLRVLLKSEAGA